MRNFLLTLLMLTSLVLSLQAQIVYEDFEGTLLNWNPSPLGNGVFNGAVTNPDDTGLNTSALCGSYTKSDAHSYSLLIAVMDEPMDLTTNNEFHIMVNAPVTSQLIFKIEGDGEAMELTQNIPSADVWREYVFDFSAAASFTTITKIIVFFDPGVEESADTYLFDNIEAHPAGTCAGTVATDGILDDFECQRNVVYGAGWDILVPIDNPDATGANTSTTVGEYTDPVGEPWVALVIDYANPIDLAARNQFKIKIRSPKTCQFLFKLEGGDSPAYEFWQDITEIDTWVEYTIDFSSQAEANHKKISIFFNGGVDAEEGDIYYIDDMEMGEAPAPDALEDFEDGQSLGWMPFGGDTDNNGTFNGIVDNPDATGINDSPNVGKYTKGDSPWSTLSALLIAGLDLSTTPQINLQVWAPAGSQSVIMKLFSPLEGNKEVSRELPATEEWVNLEFNFEDFSSITDFESLSLIFDGGVDNSGTMFFFDNLTQSTSTINPCEGVTPIANLLDDYECQRNVVYGAGAELISAVDNPDVSANNSSLGVGEYLDPIDEWSALGFESGSSWDLSVYNQLHIKIWSASEVPLMFKLEGGTSPQKEIWLDGNSVANEWTEYIIDFSSEAMEDHARLAIFFNAGQLPTEGVSYFIDDVKWTRANYNGCIGDNETLNTTIANFQYFANGHIEQEDNILHVVDNPVPGGINTSDKVAQFVKASDGESFAGAFAVLGAPMDFGDTKVIKVKVWMNHIGNFAIKVEGSTTGAPAIEIPIANTVMNEWEEIEYDLSEVTDDANYQTLTVFVDLEIEATGEDVASYFDDIIIGDGNCSTVGVFTPINVATFNVFPNPVHNQLSIELTDKTNQVFIHNALGQQLNRTILVNGSEQLVMDVSDLQKGMYFISLLDAKGTLIGNAKFVKK